MFAGRPARANLLVALLLFGGGVLLLYAGRHLSFFYDEWTFILTRRGGAAGTYLDPHNGHLVLFSALVYKLLFLIVGLRHYVAYLAVAVVLHLLCCGLLYVLARRRMGSRLALAPTVLLLFMGTAFQVLLWPFQIAYLGAVAGGLAALAALEREEGWSEPIAAAGLIWALASSGVGLAFTAATALLILVRRDAWRRLWVVGVPAALWVIWYLGWSGGESVTSDSLLGAPQYVASAAAATTAGIAGLDSSWGPALVLALLALVGVRARKPGGAATPMLLAAVAGALVFWGLAAITRADSAGPGASRYLYIGAVFTLLALAELGLGFELRGWWRALASLLLLGAVVANLDALRGGERELRRFDGKLRASLGALEIAAPVVPPAFTPDQADAPQIAAGPYLAAIHDLGSPALTLSELVRAPESLRLRADVVLGAAERLMPRPVSAPVARRCRRAGKPGSAAVVQVRVPPGKTLRFASPPGPRGSVSVSVSVRRLADAFTPVAQTLGGGSQAIGFPADRAPGQAWMVRISSRTPVRACLS